jgi:hypothetical protein
MESVVYMLTFKPVADMLARHKKCVEDYTIWIAQKQQQIRDIETNPDVEHEDTVEELNVCIERYVTERQKEQFALEELNTQIMDEPFGSSLMVLIKYMNLPENQQETVDPTPVAFACKEITWCVDMVQHPPIMVESSDENPEPMLPMEKIVKYIEERKAGSETRSHSTNTLGFRLLDGDKNIYQYFKITRDDHDTMVTGYTGLRPPLWYVHLFDNGVDRSTAQFYLEKDPSVKPLIDAFGGIEKFPEVIY